MLSGSKALSPVLHHDDDVMAPAQDILHALKLWKEHQGQMVGFEPRKILTYTEEDIVNSIYRFHLDDGTFDLVIGKLFFGEKLAYLPSSRF